MGTTEGPVIRPTDRGSIFLWGRRQFNHQYRHVRIPFESSVLWSPLFIWIEHVPIQKLHQACLKYKLALWTCPGIASCWRILSIACLKELRDDVRRACRLPLLTIACLI